MCEETWAIIRENSCVFLDSAASGMTTSLHPINEKGHACEILKVAVTIEGRRGAGMIFLFK